MIREVNLVDYLPPYMQNYKEPVAALNAENPEFTLLWEAADKAINNHFISTADEYGISRFEKILGILPQKDDSLEVRRMRIKLRWISTTPYSLQALCAKLNEIVGKDNYKVEVGELENYLLNVTLYNQTEEICSLFERILQEWVPENMVIVLRDVTLKRRSKKSYAGAAGAQKVRYILKPMTSNKTLKAQTRLPVGSSAFIHTRLTLGGK